MLVLRSNEVAYAAEGDHRRAFFVSEGGSCVDVPFLNFVAASPVVKAAAVGCCTCDDICISLPGYSLSTLELLANFVCGKQVNACFDEATCLAGLCEALGIEHGIDVRLGDEAAWDSLPNIKQEELTTTEYDPLTSTIEERTEEWTETFPESNDSDVITGLNDVIEMNCTAAQAADCDPLACTSMETYDAESAGFSCPFCQKCFREERSFRIHVRMHSAPKKFTCYDCDTSFKRREHLDRHAQIHTNEKPYECRICHLRFRRTHHLKDHMSIHDANSAPAFNCPVCNDRFKRKSHLRDHLLIHEGKQPHVCQVCQESFRQKSQLTVHMAKHDDNKSFSCKYCQKCFKFKSSVIRHEKTAHNV